MRLARKVTDSLEQTKQWLLHDPNKQPRFEQRQLTSADFTEFQAQWRTDVSQLGGTALRPTVPTPEYVGLDIFNN